MLRFYKSAENRFSFVSNELVQETLDKLSQFRHYDAAGSDVDIKITLGVVCSTQRNRALQFVLQDIV